MQSQDKKGLHVEYWKEGVGMEVTKVEQQSRLLTSAWNVQ